MANTRDYIAAGMAGARGVRDSFIAARKNAPDYGVLGEANMKARSAQNVAITNATRGVMKAGINAKAKVENTKTKVEADKKVLDTKLGAKRFAGIVGGLGTVAVAGMSFAAPKDKEDSSWKDKHYAAQEALQLQMLERLKNGNDDDGEIPGLQEVPTYTPDEYKPGDSVGQETGASKSGDSVGQETGASKSGGITRSVSTGKGGRITQKQGEQLLIAQGMDPENARIGAAVMMGESGGQVDARSHPDLEERTGEMSVGLWQHNKNTGEDRHDFYGIKDWGELNDAETNARATYRLWKRAGGKWTDWGAYTDGSYKKFLQRKTGAQLS